VGSVRVGCVPLLGRCLIHSTEVKRLRDLYNRANSEHVERSPAPSNPGPSRLTTEQNEQIVKRYKEGLRPVDIARELGTTEWTVHHRLNRLGIERRAIGLSPTQLVEARRLYDDGESLRQLSLKFGFNDKTIKKALIAAGVVMRPRRRDVRS
jgi:DNA-binding CsgD family transcriptional regulator